MTDDDAGRGCSRAQLEAYFARVGYTGARAADEQTLAELQRAHVARIPFENLEIHLGRPMRIEPDALFEDLVARARGGYCFQMNELFARVLLALGFRVERFAARVWQGADTTVPPLNHQALGVSTGDGARFLVDVGFGSTSPTAPVPWEYGRIDTQPIGDYRIERDERFGVTVSQRERAGAWSAQYSFAPAPVLPIDFHYANHAVSTLPESFFVRQRIVSRAEGGLRQHIYGQVFTEVRDGHRTERPIEPSEEARLCRDVFGLELPSELPWLARIDAG